MGRKKLTPEGKELASARGDLSRTIETGDDISMLDGISRLSRALIAAKLPVADIEAELQRATTDALTKAKDVKITAGIKALQSSFVLLLQFAKDMEATPAAKSDTEKMPPMRDPKAA